MKREEKGRDRLSVRRNAERHYEYHYKRDERLSQPGAPKKASKKGFFRRNRSLLILLIDIVVLIILGFGVYFFLEGIVNRDEIEGYSLVLRALDYDGVVFATLTVKNVRKNFASREKQPVGEKIFVRFELDGMGESHFLSATLPSRAGEERVLRQAIPLSGLLPEGAAVEAEVSIGESTMKLKQVIKNN